MSNSLLLLSSILAFVILSTDLAYAGSLSISPSKISMDIKEGEVECVDYHIYGNMADIVIDDLWSEEEHPYDIGDYNTKTGEIEVSYPKISSDSLVNICFKANTPGYYQGIILFDKVGSNIAIGSRVEVEVENGRFGSDYLTGFSIYGGNGGRMILLFTFEALFILAVLFVLAKILRKRRMTTEKA